MPFQRINLGRLLRNFLSLSLGSLAEKYSCIVACPSLILKNFERTLNTLMYCCTNHNMAFFRFRYNIIKRDLHTANILWFYRFFLSCELYCSRTLREYGRRYYSFTIIWLIKKASTAVSFCFVELSEKKKIWTLHAHAFFALGFTLSVPVCISGKVIR